MSLLVNGVWVLFKYHVAQFLRGLGESRVSEGLVVVVVIGSLVFMRL